MKPYTSKRYKAQFFNAKFDSHQREFHTLVLLSEGQFRVRYRERNYIVNAGDSILLPAGEIYSFESESNVKLITYIHYLDVEKLHHYSKNQLIPDIENLFVTKKITRSVCDFLFSNIEAEMCNSSYEQLLNKLVTDLNKKFKKVPTMSDERVNSLLQIKSSINNEMFDDFNLDELSNRFNIDKWQLSRSFKLFFGMSLFSYIHACRIVKAKELLSYQMPISEVAYKCKYADQSHLSRFFKRFVGITPNMWLKLMKNS